MESLTVTLKGRELDMAQAMVDSGDADTLEQAVARAIHIASAVDEETTSLLADWPEAEREQLLNAEPGGLSSQDAPQRIRQMIAGLSGHRHHAGN